MHVPSLYFSAKKFLLLPQQESYICLTRCLRGGAVAAFSISVSVKALEPLFSISFSCKSNSSLAAA